RFGASRVMSVTVRVLLLTTSSLVALSFAGINILPLTIALILASMLCLGFAMQNVTVGALTGDGALAGRAAALRGPWESVLGAWSVRLGWRVTDGTTRGMAARVPAGAIGAAIADPCRPRPRWSCRATELAYVARRRDSRRSQG